jgi:hypothetical protein
VARTKVVVERITLKDTSIEVRPRTAHCERGAGATQFRGLELVLGRDPRDAWAFAQRICGVCTVVHAVASLRAVEDALAIKIPAQANLIRNLMVGMQYIHDHVVHFYHLHALDWVDVVSALKADPVAAEKIAQGISTWPNNNAARFREVQERVKTFVSSGQLGIFERYCIRHKLPEVNLIAVSHYRALDWQRDVYDTRNLRRQNPHPNFIVGGTWLADQLSTRDDQCRQSHRREGPDHRRGTSSRCTGPTGGHRQLLQGLASVAARATTCRTATSERRTAGRISLPRGVVTQQGPVKVIPFDQAASPSNPQRVVRVWGQQRQALHRGTARRGGVHRTAGAVTYLQTKSTRG